MGDGPAGQATNDGRPLVLEDLSQAMMALETGVVTGRLSNEVWFPMFYKGKSLGVLLLGATKPYLPEEVSHMERLVAQLVIGLENALIHQEVEKLSFLDSSIGAAFLPCSTTSSRPARGTATGS